MKNIVISLLFLAIAATLNAANITLGIDVLIESDFAEIKGKKVGLLTNQSGRSSNGTLSAEIFAKSKSIDLVAIFVPEHGLFGALHAGTKFENEEFLGVPVYSLYGNARNPHPKQIAQTDVLVVDIQDIGVRSYTFLSTMLYMIKAAAENNKKIYILDRPNPMGGNIIDGNVLEKGKESFVGIIPIPYVHGCTFGELALMISNEAWLGKDANGRPLKAEVEVIKMKNWNRDMTFEETGLQWFPTSPHIPSVDAIRGAAMLGIFGELGFINIGIGTTLPFQYIGSPTFKTENVIADIGGERAFDGIGVFQARYKPFYAKYNNQLCEGVILRFYNDKNFKPYQAGAKIFLAIKKHHPELFKRNDIAKNSRDMFIKVTGTDDYFNALFSDSKPEKVYEIINRGVERFRAMRTKYLLY